MADRPLARARAGNNRRRTGPGPSQVSAQIIGVVTAIGNQPLQAARGRGDDGGSGPDIACVAGRQVDDRGAAEDIGEDVEFGRLPATRRTDRLRRGPPLPPCAERCALT